jgi:putative glycosyltransferase (TIGR04372 family)
MRALKEATWPLRRLVYQTLGLLLLAGLYVHAWLTGKKIRVERLLTHRIGEMGTGAEIFLRRRQLGLLDPHATYLFIGGEAANRELYEMYKKHLVVLDNRWLTKAYDTCGPLIKRTRFHAPCQLQSNEYLEFDSGKPTLMFTAKQEATGRAELAKMGLGEKDWFVCLHVRDSAYLNTAHVADGGHSYRNCDIENFREAVKYITGLGGFVLRMGSHVNKAMTGAGPRFIDYSSLHRSEFMDIYLLAKCRFMLGTDAGMAQIATGFNVPVINTNVPFIDWAGFRAADLFIQKKVLDERQRRILSYEELLARGYIRYYQTRWLTERDLSLIENSPEEILDVTREMFERQEGTFKPEPEDEELQRRYRGLFTPNNACWGFPSRIGAAFLRKNRETLFSRTPASTT